MRWITENTGLRRSKFIYYSITVCAPLSQDLVTAVPLTYLASARVTVYSNQRTLGIRLVSRIRKNSEIGLERQTPRKPGPHQGLSLSRTSPPPLAHPPPADQSLCLARAPRATERPRWATGVTLGQGHSPKVHTAQNDTRCFPSPREARQGQRLAPRLLD